MRRFFIFIFLVAVVLGFCGYYLGHRFIESSPLLAAKSGAVWTGVSLFLFFVLIGPMLSRILPASLRGRWYVARWMINMTMGVFFAVLFYTVSVDLVVFGLGLMLDSDVFQSVRTLGLWLIVGLTFATVLVGSIQALSPKVYRVDVKLKGLPAEFNGFTIAQISDLHIGEMIGRSYVQGVVQKTNALNADLIALTGDIVDGAAHLVGPVVAELSQLKAADGAFYVTGNHEYYWGIESSLTSLRQAGIKILMNESTRIRRGLNEIAVAGVTDVSAGHGVSGHTSDPEKSAQGIPAGMIKILLAHQPVSFQGAMKAGFHLQLSGHTHGGQFFPWSLVVRMFQRYNKGLIRHQDLWIYVNRGTATWGPRLRFLIPPEITLLTLRTEL